MTTPDDNQRLANDTDAAARMPLPTKIAVWMLALALPLPCTWAVLAVDAIFSPPLQTSVQTKGAVVLAVGWVFQAGAASGIALGERWGQTTALTVCGFAVLGLLCYLGEHTVLALLGIVYYVTVLFLVRTDATSDWCVRDAPKT